MDRVVITQSGVGITTMQVCVVKDATDEEILEVCNSQNPAGVINGWTEVIRGYEADCETYLDRIHLLVTC